jgi:hypothetical protein
MPRLSRQLRICKWAGTLGCLLIVTAFVWSMFWMASYSWMTKGAAYVVTLSDGLMTLGRDSLQPFCFPGWQLESQGELWQSRFPFPVVPSIRQPLPGYHLVILPLWLPLLVLLIPTLAFLVRDAWTARRRPRPGFCRQCDYDLTGNVSGRCPECGLEITEHAT